MQKNAEVIKKVTFIGSKQFGLDTLRVIEEVTPGLVNMIISLDDSDDPRSVRNEFVAHAKKYNIDLLFSNSKAMTHEIIKDHLPDLCFVNGWYQLLSQATLSIPKGGFIGIHHSCLPKYRGGSPLVWQILNNEKTLGSSLFYLDAGTDSGDIVAQVTIKNKNLYIDQARAQLEGKILSHLKTIWPTIIDGAIKTAQQDHSCATYCAQLLPEDGHIIWQAAATDILSKIRAQSVPYPCAYSFSGDKKIKIVSARLYPDTFYGIPGQLVSFEKDTKNPIIACDSGQAIVLEKILSENNTIIPANDVLSSFKVRLT